LRLPDCMIYAALLSVCVLYVGVVVCGTPQEWLQTTMHSAEATCINV